jgi:hypothetical protein
MHSSAADVPDWIQYVIVAASGIAVFSGTLIGYVRKGKAVAGGSEVAVVSATFADRRTIEHLADTIERLERTMFEEAEEARRVRQALDQNTDALINLTRFLKRSGDP